MTKKIALVLSGGGARGIAHIGVINELLKRKYEITAIAGTSMGALVGGVYAMGKLNEFEEWMVSLDKLRMFKLLDFTFSANGLIKGDKLLNKIMEIVGDRKIEELPIPYVAVATNIIEKSEVVFKSGSIYDAVRASISIPTVFTPHNVDGNLLVDGGLLNNMPNNHVDRSNSDYMFSVNVNSRVPILKLEKEKKQEEEETNRYLQRLNEFKSHLNIFNNDEHEEKMGYFELISRTISTMIDNNAQFSLKEFPPDLLFQISRDCADTYDFYKAEYLIQLGRKTAQIELDKFEKR
jgi:NTE family protein